jgi:hypothetical protein
MHCRSLLAVAGLAVGFAFAAVDQAQAWPRPAQPRQAAPTKPVDQPAQPPLHINTLSEYSTQELRLPRHNDRQAFEAVIIVDGDAKILDLQPYSLRSPDFQVLVQDATGALVPTEAPAPQTYRGWVRGEAGSMVAASLVDGHLWATVELPGRGVWNVQPLEEMVPGAPAPRSAHVVYKNDHVLPTGEDVRCGVELNALGGGLDDGNRPAEGNAEGGVAGSGYETVEIGCDADFQYYQLNGSSVSNTVNDIENLLNSVEFIYERDVDLTFEVTIVIIRSVLASDPYSGSTTAGSHLNQLTSTWNSSPENGIRRDVAQLFTGKNLGSTIGIAFLNSACFTSAAYSVVESRYTGNFSLRQSLSAHEFGHTLSATHCDGNGDCHIMCSGNGGCNGISGANLKFGFLGVNQITAYANSGNGNCLAALPDPILPPFSDTFESLGVLDPTKWAFVDGAIVSTAGVNEPSGTRALNLDSTGSQLYADDEARTNFIQLTGQSNFVAAYYTQHRGAESNETLTIEYWGTNLRWTSLNVVVSDGVDQNQFDYHQHTLPPNAYWNEFRLRFRVDGTSSDDDWYVDNVFVGPDPGLVFGACCLTDFSCIDSVTQDQCVTASGGTWQGDDTTCVGVDCTPPLGACCLPDRSCAPNTTQHGCEVLAGGTWQGEGVACVAGLCDPPTGSCCLSSGACVDGTTEALCIGPFGGTYQGDDTLCSSTNCPQPTGACCAPDGQCFAGVTEDTCLNSIGGTYQGDDVACESVECPGGEPCPADIVSNVTFQPPPDGVVDGADLAFLLGAWGPNPGSIADIVSNVTFQPPPDGVVDGADLAFMLGDWGACK